MLFNQKSIIDIAAGRKTQTRRPIKPGDSTAEPPWTPGQLIAVQAGRGQRHFAHIEVLAVRHERVRDISVYDAIAEGYENHEDFLRAWTTIIYPDPRDPRHDIGRRCWVISFRPVAVMDCCGDPPEYIEEAFAPPAAPAPRRLAPSTGTMQEGSDE